MRYSSIPTMSCHKGWYGKKKNPATVPLMLLLLFSRATCIFKSEKIKNKFGAFFAGGMAEKPVVGGIIGPTFACILGQQFLNLRKGDRQAAQSEDIVLFFQLKKEI
jgi:hypothetical protein